MPYGIGADTLSLVPAAPFVTEPGMFFAQTRKNVLTPGGQIAAPGGGQSFSRQLPQTGILSKARLIFDGSLVVATAAVTTADIWPYGLLSDLKVNANGQTDLFSCNGQDLHVLRFTRYPAYEEQVDLFPGTVGGGNSVAVGTFPIHLEWEIPVAMDDTTLIGSLYLQSPATSITIKGGQALNTELFSANPANATLTGNFRIQTTIYEVPFDAEGKLVLPDLTKLHGFNALSVPINSVGDVRVPLIRQAGQLARLFVAARSSATNRLSALPSAAATKKIDKLTLEYGGNQRPLVYDPAATLLAENNQYYHAPVPYDRLVIDTVRENPARDAIVLQGLTELAVVPAINSAVVIGAPAEVRIVQETLY